MEANYTIWLNYGVLAHLVERFHGMEEVRSSSLLHSTTVLYLTIYAAIAQLVERIHGKDEVTGSNPVRGSIFLF